MIFGSSLDLIQGWSKQGSKYALLSTFRNWVLKVDLDIHLRDKHGHLFLWDLELFWPTFKVGQTKVENMHFCWLFEDWNFKVYLVTHLRDKHGHLFWWDLQLFWRSFKVGQTNVENMHFSRISRNWVLKVDLVTHLRDIKDTYFYMIWSYFLPRSRLVIPRLKICTFVDFLIIEILR